MMPHNTSKQFRWNTLAGVLCLFAYLLGGAKVIPGVIAAAAGAEGSHRLVVRGDALGCDIVLQHEAAPKGVAAAHHHGLAAQAFCLFAARGEGSPDHVLHFTNGFISESVRGEKRASKTAPEATPIPIPNLCGGVAPLAVRSVQHAASLDLPSPHLMALRVTVLVI